MKQYTQPSQTADEIRLEVEELEEVIAPIIRVPVGNHNETLVQDEEVRPEVEELAEVIAPFVRLRRAAVFIAMSARLTCFRPVLSLCLLILTCGLVQAQAVRPAPSSSVTAAASGEQVRFVAPGEVMQVRLEVFAPGGEKLFDSDFRPGNLLDWPAQDQQGQRVADGEYLCLVTVKALSGQIHLRHGLVRIEAGQTALRPPEQGQLSAAQAAALEGSRQAFASGSVERSTPLRILGDGEALTTTVMAHDGSVGQVAGSTSGLSLRAGDFFGRKDEVQMVLTPEGNLGLGVARPEARLDVAGLIRTSKGIVFPDGTIQTTAANPGAIRGRLSSGRAVQGGSEQQGKAGQEALEPNQVNITAGAANRIAKFAADGATLVDSTVTESPSGDIGIGTSSPGGVFDLQRSSSGDILQRLWNTGSGGAKLRYVAATGATSQLQLTDGVEWLMAIAGNNSIGMQFRVRDTGDANNEATLAGAAKMTIRRNGNVGIGTTNPGTKLEIAADATAGGFDLLRLRNTNAANPRSFRLGPGVGGNFFGIYDDDAAATRLAIDYAGNVGIGTNDPVGGKLEVQSNGIGVYSQSASGYGIYGKSTGSYGIYGYSTNTYGVYGDSATSNGVYGRSVSGADAGVYGLNTGLGRGVWGYSNLGYGVEGQSGIGIGVYGYSDSGTGGRFESNTGDAGYFKGNVYVTGSITQNSDARLKQGVANLGYGLREVLRLRPVTWRWKDNPEGKLQLGLISQEVRMILPELVTEGRDEAKTLGLNYVGLVPVLIKAVQEQQTTLEHRDVEITAIKTENAALKERNAELDARLTALEQALQQLLGQQDQPQRMKHQ
ncbi:MAG TPA: tail fiber domain-containing protein [Blastocatellia bacterium]|nr:tail fiber domain-containing protein [Blastocatellia bacterium]